MLLIWIGVLLVIVGLLFTARQAIWRGRMSDPHRARSGPEGMTLEPKGSGTAGSFGLKANWPGLALIGLGAIFLLVGAAV
jgi:hypothetical protein